jgi:DNA polymerase I
MKLLLIDGHALAYRSYYALIRNPLTNSTGENTSAEFGFIRALQALRREQTPDALLVTFDPPGKTFRHESYPEYKAQRAKTPPELKESVGRIQEFLDLAGISRLTMEGYEADDVMASAARQAAASDWDVIIFSGDKDLCQLVDERISVLRPSVGRKPARQLGPAEVGEEFGVPPERLQDYLSLIGDSADNVPGVKGLGPKGSVNLLREFAGLDEIYANIENIAAAGLRKKLSEGRESAYRARELIRLVEDLELSAMAPDWAPAEPDHEGLKAWLADRDFHSMIKEFGKGAAAPVDRNYELVNDEAALAKLLKRLASAERFAVDTETTGLDPLVDEMVGLSLAFAEGEACYLPVAGRCVGEALSLARLQEALAEPFADPSKEKIAQHLKFDARVLARAGIPLDGPCFDTMLASYCVDPGRRSHGLDALALELLGHGMIPFAELFEPKDKVKDIRTVPMDRLAHYAAEDADFTLRLFELLRPALAEAGVESLFHDIEMPLSPVLGAMEEQGIALDLDHLAELSGRMALAREALAARIHEAAGREFTIGSPKQLSAVLFEEMGLPKGRRTKTGYSTDEQVLSELAAEHPIAGWVLEWRELSKLKNTYVDVLPTMVSPVTDRVHTRYNQAVAATGRLSSSDPNLQNIPIRSDLGKEIRRAFVAEPGNLLVSFDYSQVELRILAELCGDQALREAFIEDRDIHRWTAARIAGKPEEEVDRDERSRSKAVNFGILYGMGAHGLASRLRIGREEAQGFIDDYFGTFPGIRVWIDETLARARLEGSVSTLLGRRRALPEINSGNGRVRSFAERVATNTPIQGTAADLIKLAMIRIHDLLEVESRDFRMLLQVHDELVFETPAAELEALAALVVPAMEGVAEFAVPLKVDWGSGSNWLEAH